MKFLSQTDCRLLETLYSIYLPDFYLFGYSMQEYQQFADGGRGCNLSKMVEK